MATNKHISANPLVAAKNAGVASATNGKNYGTNPIFLLKSTRVVNRLVARKNAGVKVRNEWQDYGTNPISHLESTRVVAKAVVV
jgi:hypothetical protein